MKSISVKDLAALGDATEIVDVREEDEYAAVRVPGARSIPLSRFVQSLDEVPASGTVYVMCAAGAAAPRPPPTWRTRVRRRQRHRRDHAVAGRGHPVNRG